MCNEGLKIALVLVCLALFLSLCVNIIFYMRQRGTVCKEPNRCCNPHSSEEETLSAIEGQYFSDLSHQERQENPHNHQEQQENPIYGNINTERGSSEVCYEMMSRQRTRDCLKPSVADLNYASLDLKIAKKHKKHRHLQGQAKGRHTQQDPLADHLTSPSNAFLEVDTKVDAHLPSRDTRVMVSHSSIYLNSQQIAQEADEIERERGFDMENVGWDGLQESEEAVRKDWDKDQESEERKDNPGNCIGNISILHSEVETTQRCSEQVTDSFSRDTD